MILLKHLQVWSEELLIALDDIRPRHDITTVYPPERKHIDNEFTYNITEDQCEKTVVRYDILSKVMKYHFHIIFL